MPPTNSLGLVTSRTLSIKLKDTLQRKIGQMAATNDSIEKQILAFYTKDDTRPTPYRSKNPVSINEILYKLLGEDSHAKYKSSTFCKQKHEALKKTYYGYTFHCLTVAEMRDFIDEVSAMAEGAKQ